MTAAGVLILAAVAVQVVEGQDPPFRLALPRGYELVQEKEPARFYLKETRGERLVLTVQRLDGEISPGAAASDPAFWTREFQAVNPAAADVSSRIELVPWRGHEIECVEFRFARDGVSYAALSALVPTISKALRVEVLGPRVLEGQVREDLLDVLSRLEGMPSWITPRQTRLMRQAPLPALAAISAGALYLLAYLLAFRSRPRAWLPLRIAAMLLIAALSLLSPLLWGLLLDNVRVPAPAMCDWPVPGTYAALWVFLAVLAAVRLCRRPRVV